MKLEQVPLKTMTTVYLSYLFAIILGNLKDLYDYLFCRKSFLFKKINGFNPIISRIESFFIRRCYTEISDVFNRPITKFPSKYIEVLERKFHNKSEIDKLEGRNILLMNFGSYNYLGYASKDAVVNEPVRESLKVLPFSLAGTQTDLGTHPVVRELENELADFLYKEDCMVFSMGYGTNSGAIPIFTSNGDLILSDELNHKSIITGAKLSGATTKTFPHNNMVALETILRREIAHGQTKTLKPWKRIFVFVEGIYSMEGTIVNLKELVELKKKYGFYIFVDEAHSIGALGETGRGVCEYAGVNFDDIDMLMGTFSKSFAGMGGYIASTKKIINFLKRKSDLSKFGEQLSPIVANQILECLKDLKYGEGKKYPSKLMENSAYMRKRLIDLGYVVFGDTVSPVIPVLIFHPGKIGEFSSLCYEKGLAVVVVGYPATPVITSRVRLCLSYYHTKEDIDIAVRIINHTGKLLGMNILKK